MARSNKITSQSICTLNERFPFDMSVAEHARIWGATCQVLIYKIVDHIISKFFTDINYKMVKSFFNRYLPCIIDAIKAAATRFLTVSPTCSIIPCLHGDPNDLIALFLQDHG